MKKILLTIVNLMPFKIRIIIKYIPGIKQLQLWLFEKYMSGNSFNQKINGGPANGLIYPIELPLDKQIWLGTYELSFTQVLAESILKGNVCYDIGGYRGFFSGVMGLNGAAEVHVFEPLPENVAQIKRVIELNPELKMFVHPLAISNATGDTEFMVMPSSSMGKLESSKFGLNQVPEKSIKVKMESLDSLIISGKYSIPTLLKIDVEGAEFNVLKGGFRLLSQHSPLLLIEVHSRILLRECTEYLFELDYSIVELETGLEPRFDFGPEVCHILARATKGLVKTELP